MKKLFLKISQHCKKKTVLEFLLNKVAGLQDCKLIEKRLQHRCFPVNIVKLLRKSILKNICKRLLLIIFYCSIYLFSAFSLQSKKKQWSFMVKKMFIEIKLCNPMTYFFKGHFKIVKINMIKFNVSILIRFKIMGLF